MLVKISRGNAYVSVRAKPSLRWGTKLLVLIHGEPVDKSASLDI